eukprot:gene4269-8495_t
MDSLDTTKEVDMILLPCHALYQGGDPSKDESWLMASFQTGEGSAFVEHLRKTFVHAQHFSDALVVVSGGSTKKESLKSEASSYLELAQALQFITPELEDRIVLEEFARDSLENLAYGAAVFEEHRSYFPNHILVVGWEFKRARFLYHAETLSLSITYDGCGKCLDESATRSQEQKTLSLFHEDPLGKHQSLCYLNNGPWDLYVGLE